MYGFYWQHLPGRWPVKLVETFALLLGALALLFYVIFPYADDHLPWNDVRVSGQQTTPAPPARTSAPATTPPSAGTTGMPSAGPSSLPGQP